MSAVRMSTSRWIPTGSSTGRPVSIDDRAALVATPRGADGDRGAHRRVDFQYGDIENRIEVDDGRLGRAVQPADLDPLRTRHDVGDRGDAGPPPPSVPRRGPRPDCSHWR